MCLYYYSLPYVKFYTLAKWREFKTGVKMDKKKLISEGYMALVIKAHTTNVKVSDICKQAQISRKTFYYYFKDKHDIIEYIFCEEIEQTMTMGWSTALIKRLRQSSRIVNFWNIRISLWLLWKKSVKIHCLRSSFIGVLSSVVKRLTSILMIRSP